MLIVYLYTFTSSENEARPYAHANFINVCSRHIKPSRNSSGFRDKRLKVELHEVRPEDEDDFEAWKTTFSLEAAAGEVEAILTSNSFMRWGLEH